MQCEDLSLQLAGLVGKENGELSDLAKPHFFSCLRCQAEMAQYRKMAKTMKLMRHSFELPDGELLNEILDAVRPSAEVHRLPRKHMKAAYLGGIAAAATAGAAAGAIVIASRLASKQKLAS